MASNLVIFLIIMTVALAVGGIVTGTYVSVEDKKPENKDNPVSVTTITFMMLTFALSGFVAYGGYHYLSAPMKSQGECPTSIISSKMLDKVNKAFATLTNYTAITDKLPRMTVHEMCASEPCLNKMAM